MYNLSKMFYRERERGERRRQRIFFLFAAGGKVHR